MSLNTINDMRNSQSLRERITAAATKAGVLTAEQWSADNMLVIVTAPGWEAAWDFAEANKTRNVNPDTGYRDDVIDDGMIAAAVQARIDALIAVEPLDPATGEAGWPTWMDPTKKPKKALSAGETAPDARTLTEDPDPQPVDGDVSEPDDDAPTSA